MSEPSSRTLEETEPTGPVPRKRCRWALPGAEPEQDHQADSGPRDRGDSHWHPPPLVLKQPLREWAPVGSHYKPIPPSSLPRTPGGFSHVYKKARGVGWPSGPWRFLPGRAAVALFHKGGDRICRGVAAPGPAPSSLRSWAAGCPFSRSAPPRHASERRPDPSARLFPPCRDVWHRPSSAAQPGGVGGQASVHTRPRRQDEVSSAGVSCPDPQTRNTRRLVLVSGKRRSLGVAGRWTMTDSRKEGTLDTEDSVGTQAPTHAYREGLCNSLQARGRGEHRGGGRPGPAQITRPATQVTGLLFPFEANIQAYPLNFTAHKIPVLRLSNKPPAASPPGGGTRGTVGRANHAPRAPAEPKELRKDYLRVPPERRSPQAST